MALPADVTLFDYRPNWQSPVTETREYLTDILISRDRTEQRRALRSKPRQTLEYTVLLEGVTAASLDWRMWSRQPYTWAVPHWARGMRLAQGADASTLTLAEAVTYDLRPGQEVILMAGDRVPAVVTVATIPDTFTLTLDAPLDLPWGAGSRVYPLWRAVVDGAVSTRRHTSTVVEAQVRFRRVVDVALWQPPAPGPQVDGLERLIAPVNWSDGLGVDWDWANDLVDARSGPFHVEPQGSYPARIRQGTLLLDSREAADDALRFFDRVRGRQGQFLSPTWEGDLRLVDPLDSGYLFVTAGAEFADYVGSGSIYTHIYVRHRDGSHGFYPLTTDVVADPARGVTQIGTTGWAQSYAPHEAPYACLATPGRFASDTLTLTWHTDGVAEIPLAVQSTERVL